MKNFKQLNDKELYGTQGGSIWSPVVISMKVAKWVSGFFK